MNNNSPIKLSIYLPQLRHYLQKKSNSFFVHSDAGHLIESKGKSHDSTNIHLSENVPIPTFNGAVLTTAQIIKHVMSSVAKDELASLFIIARKHVSLRQTLIET